MTRSREVEPEPASSPDAARRAGLRQRGVRAGGAGLLLAATTYALLSQGYVAGFLQVGLAAVLLCAFPTAASLSRRVAVNGSLAIGWLPLLWWFPWPLEVNHGALALAVALGAQICMVLLHQQPATYVRRLVPQVKRVDSLLIVSAGAAILATQDWVFASSPRRALELLLPGVDNFAHFHMFATTRAHGLSLNALGRAGDGSHWAFEDYPQGFHSLVGTVSELMYPHLTPGPQTVVAYVHGVAAVVVLGTVVLTATILALPRLDRRPAIALPVTTLVCAAYLWEPGQKILANGFGNFWLAAVSASCALLLNLSAGRVRGPVNVVAVAGLLVSVAHTWTPLLVISGAAVLVVLFAPDTSGTARERRHRRYASWLVLAISALAIAKALAMLLSSVRIGFLVTAFGGINGTSPLPTFVLMVVTLYVGWTYPAWLRSRGRGGQDIAVAARVRLSWLGPLAGVALATALLFAQMRTLGETSYYLLKYLMGLELILTAVAAGICGMLVATVTRRMSKKSLGVGLSITATIVASQAFGRFPGGDPLMLSETDPGTAGIHAPFTRPGIAAGVISAVQASSPERSMHQEYLPLGRSRAAQAFYPDAWFHVINVSLTDDVGARMTSLRVPMKDVEDALPPVRKLLEADPDLQIVVDPRYAESLRGRLAEPGLATRVLSWTDGPTS